jgi:predicted RNA-binding protein YlxR (DUF448 family)
MCIICRIREYPFNLIRLQVLNNILVLFQGKQRSFYMCKSCIKDSKIFNRFLNKRLKIKEINHLCKEIIEKCQKQ